MFNFVKQALVSKELSLLKSILSLSVEYEMLNRNPFDSYNFKKVLKDYEPKERWLTPEEAQLLITNSNELLATLLIFLFNSGLRITEALNILDLVHKKFFLKKQFILKRRVLFEFLFRKRIEIR